MLPLLSALVFCLVICVFFFPALADDRPIQFDPNYCSFLNSLANSPGYAMDSPTMKSSSASRVYAQDPLEASKAYILKNLATIPSLWLNYFGISQAQWNFTVNAIESTACVYNASVAPFDYHPYIPQAEGEWAAPASHKVVYNNPLLKVIDWNLYANTRENYHTHGLASMMFLLIRSARAYYDWNSGNAPANVNKDPVDPNNPGPILVTFMQPEFLHSIENLEAHTYHVMRILFVPFNGEKNDYHWPATDKLG